MANSKEIAKEDLAIQDTLSMTVEERLELLANLIAGKIVEDQQNDEGLLTKIVEISHGN